MKKYIKPEFSFTYLCVDVVLLSTLDDDPFVQDAYSGLKGLGGDGL